MTAQDHQGTPTTAGLGDVLRRVMAAKHGPWLVASPDVPCRCAAHEDARNALALLSAGDKAEAPRPDEFTGGDGWAPDEYGAALPERTEP